MRDYLAWFGAFYIYVKLLPSSLAALALAAAMTALSASAALAADPTPSPSASPCTKPVGENWSVSADHVAAGDAVTVSGGRDDLCNESATYDYRLLARPTGHATFTEVDRVTARGFSFEVRPTVSTTYEVLINGSPMNSFDSTGGHTERTVIVDRTSGSCADAVTLTGPVTAPTGSAVRVNGTAPDTGTVDILFRKRGQTTFQVRRVITPRADRTFSVGFLADDDYRLYASSSRCDSPPLLVQAQPTISGPATVAKGSTVTLLVRAPAGFPVKVYFHRAGTTGYQLARNGTVAGNGRYTTTYTASADYRYYAVAGNDRRQSNTGLTQVR